jgi:DnaJ domain
LGTVGVVATHYETLGVARSASAAEVRRAYLARARSLHPDRYVDAGPERRRAVERQMQDVNEAWRVLGDPGRRGRYDHDTFLRAPSPTAPGPGGPGPRFDDDLDIDVEEEPALDGTTWLIRGLPWIVLLAVLAMIFVFTAYATDSGSPDVDAELGCVVVENGPVARPRSCTTAGAREIMAVVDAARQCPEGTERLQPVDRPTALCLEVASSP